MIILPLLHPLLFILTTFHLSLNTKINPPAASAGGGGRQGALAAVSSTQPAFADPSAASPARAWQRQGWEGAETPMIISPLSHPLLFILTTFHHSLNTEISPPAASAGDGEMQGALAAVSSTQPTFGDPSAASPARAWQRQGWEGAESPMIISHLSHPLLFILTTFHHSLNTKINPPAASAGGGGMQGALAAVSSTQPTTADPSAASR